MTNRWEAWRVVTPILLTVLSALVTTNLFILNDVNGRIVRMDDKITTHLANGQIHERLVWEMAWVKKQLKLSDEHPLVS